MARQLTASQEKDIIDNFVHKLGGKARITPKMVRRVEPQYIPYDDFKNKFYHHYLNTYEEQLVEMELPLSNFRELAEHANDIEELRAHFGPNIDEIGQRIMTADYAYRREARIRAENPAVQKAWERYQTMLKIAGG